MKRKKHAMRTICLAAVLFAGWIQASAHKDYRAEYLHHVDSAIQIGLLTCQPSQEVYSLYGHTAIHYVNSDEGIDVAVNYGMFSFSKPFFVLRFVFGLTDYEMGIQDYHDFCISYAIHRRGITEQVLNIPPREKLRFAEAIAINNRPENREYRYNYFYDNCTTRARDMILGNMKQHINYRRTDGGPSFRQMIHAYTEDHLWARFGNDMLLGVMADRPTSVGEQQFLPDHLMADFDSATFRQEAFSGSGQAQVLPLMKERREVVPYFQQPEEGGFPLRPRTCFLLLLLVTMAITLAEYATKRSFLWFDLLLMLASGLAGCILFAMLFSQHPTVRLNLQLLLLNPLPLFLMKGLFVRREKAARSRWGAALLVLVCLFFIGGLWQTYAEGMYLLASSLLIRIVRWRTCPARSSIKPLSRTIH